MSANLRLAIFGAGGVGGYYGGRLAQAGEDVTFIARGPHLDALQGSGLVIKSIEGDAALTGVRATNDPASIGPVDVVVVAVKTWQLEGAVEAMGPLIGAETAILPLLNGVEAFDQIAAAHGPGRVLKGLTTIISFLSAPGEITHVGAKPTIAFGEANNAGSVRADRLADVLAGAGIVVERPPDMDVALWTKLLFVVSFGGVGTVTRAPIGVIRTVPETRRMLETAMREIEAVARGHGVDLPADIVETALQFIDGLPAEGTTSLQRDIAEGRRSELDAWSGAVVRLGEEAGIDTPVHRFVYESALPLELRARGEVSPFAIGFRQ